MQFTILSFLRLGTPIHLLSCAFVKNPQPSEQTTGATPPEGTPTIYGAVEIRTTLSY